MSFILDALRKSEHERQRSEVPGLSQVPLATPQPQLPRWALAVIGVLVAAVLGLGGAWWLSASAPAESAAPTVERSVELPPPSLRSAVPQQGAPARPLSQNAGGSSLASAAAPSPNAAETSAPAFVALPPGGSQSDSPALPSAAALAAEGVLLPTLRLELHAFSAQPRDRFVFINGRKYVEGERLVEGPQLVAIEPTGAVLTHSGRRFMLVQE